MSMEGTGTVIRSFPFFPIISPFWMYLRRFSLMRPRMISRNRLWSCLIFRGIASQLQYQGCALILTETKALIQRPRCLVPLLHLQLDRPRPRAARLAQHMREERARHAQPARAGSDVEVLDPDGEPAVLGAHQRIGDADTHRLAVVKGEEQLGDPAQAQLHSVLDARRV